MRLTRWAVPGTAFGVLVAALAGCGGGANNIFNPSQPSQPSSTSQPSNGATPPAETVFVSDNIGVASSDVGPDVIDVFNSHISNGGKFTAQITNSNMTTAYNIATSGGSIYVSNWGQSGGPGAAIFVFLESANGPTTPTRKISGPASQLVAPQGIAVDNSGIIYVADSTGGPNGNGQVDIYGPGSGAPQRTLGGTLSQIDQPTGIAVDSQGDVFVANDAGGSVGGSGSLLEFAPGAGFNTAPIFVYGNGQLSAPVAVALDDVGNILVSCDGNNQILEFASNTPSSIGSLLQNNGIAQPQGLVADNSGFLYVVNQNTSNISGIGPNVAVYGSGASQPVLTFAGNAGSQNTFVAPSGIAL